MGTFTNHGFANSGCTKVAILDLDEAGAKSAAQDLVREFETGATQDDLRVLGVGCDVSSEQGVRMAYKQVLENFGRLDAVVASAGN
jgi:NAD(P)-dependent dehydrogenase (short-subunit alcohol dehydrogenase family)